MALRFPALAGAFLALAVALPPTVAHAAEEPTAAAPQPPTVSIVRAAERELVARITVTGTLVPRETVVVGAEVDGLRIEALLADEGDRVKANAVLARLSTDMIGIDLARNDSQVARADAAIAQAKSQIVEAEATSVEAAASSDRTESLKKKGVVGQDILDQRVSAASAAAARLASARQGLALAEADKALTLAERRELDLKKARTEIKAPAGGLILSRAARVGAMATASGPTLFEIARDGLIELEADVTETDLQAVKTGDEVTVTLAGGAPVLGRVRLVSPKVDQTTRLGRVRVALPSSEDVRAGTFAPGLIETARSRGVVVPITAVVIDGEEAVVQVVRAGKIESRKVTLGISSGPDVEIVKGLTAGEAVVAVAGTFVRDGDSVTGVEAKMAEARP